MLNGTFNYTPPSALTGSARDYRYPRGADLQARIEGFYKWQNLRRQHGLWPFSRSAEESPSPVTAARDDAGGHFRGVNFASEDYLNLASHPAIKQVAHEVIDQFGMHSAGTAAMLGATAHSVRLERRIADFLGAAEAILFPTGWAAAYGAIKGLVRPTDHVLMDALAHPSLKEGAASATKNIYLFRHNSVEECRRWLQKIRAKDVQNGVMVVTESLFALESDTPDLRALQALCHEFNATLLVDAAHDLGALGPAGKGALGDQDLLGKVDLVVGTFSKSFGSNGGFVACRSREAKEYLRFFSPSCAYSTTLSPIQAATAMKAFEIIESAEGQTLRDRLLGNIQGLRRSLIDAGFEVHGAPSGVVCVKIGAEGLARLVARRLPDAGLIANLVEFPDVPKGHARIRLQVMANHTDDNLGDAVTALATAHAAACEEFEWLTRERDKLRAHG
ncbi:aminotransferase class I/II-fold pyridoxal phosphate-dependent enzyme [Phenylobacterium sp. LjRoot225]|uniref:aminotransferase class I/II-fold pyridoxal phosphate-dependent enzyme n=1 Tax=Phenylobacterium sp. LjRoot225 TaxID=3342285 RepID=UPI003ED14748